jgi:hypothetical protein
LGDIPVTAVGVATPAVLTKDLAEGCSSYITSLVLMVRGADGLARVGTG